MTEPTPGRALTAPSTPFPPDLLTRFCGLFGPSLIDNALPGVLDPGLVRQARLLNRLSTQRQRDAVAGLVNGGHRVAAMKGFATSRLYHRDLEARTTGDIDLLVEPGEIKSLVARLLEQGYRASTELPLPPWGFVSEASFLPMTSADGLVDIDLHVL
ncbi:MAG: nucleotidyltransferase family protein, partial [Proteobacteria bacterium]|nr:nucleotidyltransferase family protein [Pseudomonadota bacterium]